MEIIVHTNDSLVQSFTILQLLDTKALNAENLEPTSVSRIAVVVTAVLDSESTKGGTRVGQS